MLCPRCYRPRGAEGKAPRIDSIATSARRGFRSADQPQPASRPHSRCAWTCLSVDYKAALCDRAEPDLVVAFALPLEAAVAGEQESFELRGEGRAHQEAKRTFSWRWLVSSKAMASG